LPASVPTVNKYKSWQLNSFESGNTGSSIIHLLV